MRLFYGSILLAAIFGCSTEQVSNGVASHLDARRAALHPNPRYVITPLPTAGAGTAQGGGINNEGWVAGYTGTSNGTRQAALWREGSITPLGTLPGGAHSMVQWPGLNNNGVVVGISRTGDPDLLGESWSCSAFLPGSGKVCLGFAWVNGIMSPLPTLGGTNGFAAGVNVRGQIVGWAENTIHDPTCNAPQVLQFRAVVWENGNPTPLPPFPGDSTSAATAINQSGQVVGISGDCDVAVGRRSARHAVLWDHGVPQDLGNLGGTFWHTPMAINEHGDVVGFGNPPDGDLDGDSLRAFSWTRATGIKDLGRLQGDEFSQALGLNERGQIVGVSCKATCQAILWQDDQMLILKNLVDPSTFNGRLFSARSINDAGVITGRMFNAGGTPMPYIATPIDPVPNN
jgi:probable HAF family extracellular repeat protein